MSDSLTTGEAVSAVLSAEPPPWSNSPRLSRKARDDVVAVNEPNGQDPDNYPLNSPWTIWHDMTQRRSTAEDFFANLKPLCTVKTIKAFWGAVNNIRPVERLGERESYHLMRGESRRPIWEDADNADGGLWSFKVGKMHTPTVWQELLLAAVGEQFEDCVEEGDRVCGVSVRIRGFDQDIVQIWNQDSELHTKATVIQKVKDLIPIIDIKEFYQSNRAKMKESLMKPAPYHQHSHHHHGGPPQMYGGSHRYPGPPPPRGSYPSRAPPHYQPQGGMYQPRPRGMYPGPLPPPPGMYPMPPQQQQQQQQQHYRPQPPRQYRPAPPHS